MKVFVDTSRGAIPVNCKPSDFVATLKQKYLDHEGFNGLRTFIPLAYGGELMDDMRQLRDYGIVPGSHVQHVSQAAIRRSLTSKGPTAAPGLPAAAAPPPTPQQQLPVVDYPALAQALQQALGLSISGPSEGGAEDDDAEAAAVQSLGLSGGGGRGLVRPSEAWSRVTGEGPTTASSSSDLPAVMIGQPFGGRSDFLILDDGSGRVYAVPADGSGRSMMVLGSGPQQGRRSPTKTAQGRTPSDLHWAVAEEGVPSRSQKRGTVAVGGGGRNGGGGIAASTGLPPRSGGRGRHHAPADAGDSGILGDEDHDDDDAEEEEDVSPAVAYPGIAPHHRDMMARMRHQRQVRHAIVPSMMSGVEGMGQMMQGRGQAGPASAGRRRGSSGGGSSGSGARDAASGMFSPHLHSHMAYATPSASAGHRGMSPAYRTGSNGGGGDGRSFKHQYVCNAEGHQFKLIHRLEGRWSGDMEVHLATGRPGLGSGSSSSALDHRVVSTDLRWHGEEGVWAEVQTLTSRDGLTSQQTLTLVPMGDGVCAVELGGSGGSGSYSGLGGHGVHFYHHHGHHHHGHHHQPGFNQDLNITLKEVMTEGIDTPIHPGHGMSPSSSSSTGCGVLVLTATSTLTGLPVLIETTVLLSDMRRVRTVQRFAADGTLSALYTTKEARVIDTVTGAMEAVPMAGMAGMTMPPEPAAAVAAMAGGIRGGQAKRRAAAAARKATGGVTTSGRGGAAAAEADAETPIPDLVPDDEAEAAGDEMDPRLAALVRSFRASQEAGRRVGGTTTASARHPLFGINVADLPLHAADDADDADAADSWTGGSGIKVIPIGSTRKPTGGADSSSNAATTGSAVDAPSSESAEHSSTGNQAPKPTVVGIVVSPTHSA